MKMKLKTLRSLIYGHLLTNHKFAVTGFDSETIQTRDAKLYEHWWGTGYRVTDPRLNVFRYGNSTEIHFRYWMKDYSEWDWIHIYIRKNSWDCNRVDNHTVHQMTDITYDAVLEIVDKAMESVEEFVYGS